MPSLTLNQDSARRILRDIPRKGLAGYRSELRALLNQILDALQITISVDENADIQEIKGDTPGVHITFRAAPAEEVGDAPAAEGLIRDPVADPHAAGTDVTLTIDSLTGTAPFYYQWMINGYVQPGEIADTFTHTLATADAVDNNGDFNGVVNFTVAIGNRFGITAVSGSLNMTYP